ncbi:hypothetical protein F5H01DRAFT_330837 [Linnemannia elongata]|nr:hypothetical protein F5H01DRAFT_358593 [Linnemannia elongata]KAK5816285.1 hypothetical protein F5H01DRAFT_344119 [Linnemannia elongata]KAK5827140.1 hypothetical protein F5H01DRAFT_330837 [Linnemannia elongata]
MKTTAILHLAHCTWRKTSFSLFLTCFLPPMTHIVPCLFHHHPYCSLSWRRRSLVRNGFAKRQNKGKMPFSGSNKWRWSNEPGGVMNPMEKLQ